VESGKIEFLILLESIIPGQAAVGLTRGMGGDLPGPARENARPDASPATGSPHPLMMSPWQVAGIFAQQKCYLL